MREIKFRGYRADDVGWVYGSLVINENCLIVNEKGVLGYKTGYFIYDREGAYEVYENSVGQFTECKSVYGVDIYEGDIVVWLDSDRIERRNIIEFVNGGFVVCNNRYNLGSYCTYENQPKIAGNIYENPNLINELEK